jgi:hypothetical protein
MFLAHNFVIAIFKKEARHAKWTTSCPSIVFTSLGVLTQSILTNCFAVSSMPCSACDPAMGASVSGYPLYPSEGQILGQPTPVFLQLLAISQNSDSEPMY